MGAAGTVELLSLGISARVGFGEGWVTTIAYSGGVTQLDLSRNGLIASPETVSSPWAANVDADNAAIAEDAARLRIGVRQALADIQMHALGAQGARQLGVADQQRRRVGALRDLDQGLGSTHLERGPGGGTIRTEPMGAAPSAASFSCARAPSPASRTA